MLQQREIAIGHSYSKVIGNNVINIIHRKHITLYINILRYPLVFSSQSAKLQIRFKNGSKQRDEWHSSWQNSERPRYTDDQEIQRT